MARATMASPADAALVLALMGEQHAMVDVAGGVQPTTRHLAHRHGVVDVEPGPGHEPHGAEPEIAAARLAARGDEQLVRLQRGPVAQGQGDRPAGAANSADDADARADLDAARQHGVVEQLSCDRLEPRQEPVGHLHQAHPAAEAGPGLGQLATGDPAPEHRKATGCRLGPGSVLGGPRPRLEEPGNGRHGRLGACGDGNCVVRSQRHSPACGGHLDPPFPGEPPVAAHEVDVRPPEPGDLAVVAPMMGETVAAGQDCRDVQLTGDGLAGAADTTGRGEGVAWAQQRLARHAGPVRAVPADEISFDDDGRKAPPDDSVR